PSQDSGRQPRRDPVRACAPPRRLDRERARADACSLEDGGETMMRSLTVAVAMVASPLLLLGGSPAMAADSPIGTWMKKREAGKPAMTLIIEEWGPGKAKLTWHVGEAKMELTLVSSLDG